MARKTLISQGRCLINNSVVLDGKKKLARVIEIQKEMRGSHAFFRETFSVRRQFEQDSMACFVF